MELMEVLATQVVCPVVLVVLCAFLVFLFGFKQSPEPTFEYDALYEEKKTKKSKGKKKTEKEKISASNGHVVHMESAKSNNSKPNVEREKPPKTKQKKSSKPVKEVPDKVVIEKDEGGWTTAVSKKDKKKKRFEDDVLLQAIKQEDNTTSNSEPDDEPSQVQSQSHNLAEKQNIESIRTKDNLPLKKPRDDQLPENTYEKSTESLTTKEEIKIITKKDEESKIESSKKNKKKRKKAADESVTEVLPKQVFQEPAKVEEIYVAPEPDPIEVQIADAMKETSNTIQPEIELNKEITKSPSRNKKNKKAKSTVSMSAVSSSHISDSSGSPKHQTSLPESLTVKGIKEETFPEKVQLANVAEHNTSTNIKQVESISKLSAEKTVATSEASGDQLGEWQEAKTVKKRKKPRRDN